MSRAVSLRWGGRPVEARLTLGGGKAVLEAEGRRVEAAVSRDGPWIELSIGERVVRAASARDARGTWVSLEGRVHHFEVAHRHADAPDEADRTGEVRAPMTGRIMAIEAHAGAPVREGDLLLTVEAMKMEFKVTAPASGRVDEVACAAGDRVELGQVLVRIGAPPSEADVAP